MSRPGPIYFSGFFAFSIYYNLNKIYKVDSFSYYIDKEVCYLTMCEREFSKRTAFSYLEELSSQFYADYGNKINSVARPYSFIEFGKYSASSRFSYEQRFLIFFSNLGRHPNPKGEASVFGHAQDKHETNQQRAAGGA